MLTSEGITLPDLGDRHVVAAAIKGRADLIITFNLNHFPEHVLKMYDLDAENPDEFVSNLINLDSKKCFGAFNSQVSALKNPPQKKEDVLQTLLKCGLPKTVELLHAVRI